MKEKRIYPPWNLKGNGYIFLYRLPEEFLREYSFISDFFINKFHNYLSALIIVDYQDSNVGAYNEIIFVPGLFDFNNKKYPSISKIYVDSQSSIYNGIENWAIPKEYADFKIAEKDNSTIVEILKNNQTFFKAEINNNSFKIPFTNSFLPFNLIQHKNSETFINKFSAKGLLNKAKINISCTDKDFFPDLTNFTPIIGFKINNFNMFFSEAKIFNE